jgi:nitrite reductase/ring-hydroxylating ferredoxin subunit
MSKADRRLTRFVEALIANRRPPRSPADDDSSAMQVAARLRAAHPGGSTPSPAFVDKLARQLREAADHEPTWTEAGIRRRRFLVGGLATIAASVAAGVGVERIREVLTDPTSGSGTIQPYKSTWAAVALLDEVTTGKIKSFSAGGVQGVVFTLKGEIRALSAVCTHQGCTLVPQPDKSSLACPCHPMSFNLNGDPNPGGDYRLNPLPAIQTRVNAGHVEVLVPAHWD